MLLEDSFATASKGKFVNEITKDRDNGVFHIANSSSINGYVTEKYFDLCNRVEQEINKPYNIVPIPSNKLHDKYKIDIILTPKKLCNIGDKLCLQIFTNRKL